MRACPWQPGEPAATGQMGGLLLRPKVDAKTAASWGDVLADLQAVGPKGSTESQILILDPSVARTTATSSVGKPFVAAETLSSVNGAPVEI
jgi:hypothetical protein